MTARQISTGIAVLYHEKDRDPLCAKVKAMRQGGILDLEVVSPFGDVTRDELEVPSRDIVGPRGEFRYWDWARGGSDVRPD